MNFFELFGNEKNYKINVKFVLSWRLSYFFGGMESKKAQYLQRSLWTAPSLVSPITHINANYYPYIPWIFQFHLQTINLKERVLSLDTDFSIQITFEVVLHKI